MNLAKYIDHTLLKADASDAQIEQLCHEAKEHGFKSVCVNPGYVSRAYKLLKGSDVLVCTVIGFPLGANTIATKVFETRDAVARGADEIDMVINVSRAREGDFRFIEAEIAAVCDAAFPKTVKVILETCYLTDDQIVGCCIAASNAGADFVKTSTGFGTGGATVEHVKLMREAILPDMKVKASGGIRTYADAKAMIEAGAERIGASSGIAILEGAQAEQEESK